MLFDVVFVLFGTDIAVPAIFLDMVTSTSLTLSPILVTLTSNSPFGHWIPVSIVNGFISVRVGLGISGMFVGVSVTGVLLFEVVSVVGALRTTVVSVFGISLFTIGCELG